jgi:hypothetical protein
MGGNNAYHAKELLEREGPGVLMIYVGGGGGGGIGVGVRLGGGVVGVTRHACVHVYRILVCGNDVLQIVSQSTDSTAN